MSSSSDTQQAEQDTTPGDDVEEWDTVAFDAYDTGTGRVELDEPAAGTVMIATADTLRVRGIGTVDVDRADVVEIIEKAED